MQSQCALSPELDEAPLRRGVGRPGVPIRVPIALVCRRSRYTPGRCDAAEAHYASRIPSVREHFLANRDWISRKLREQQTVADRDQAEAAAREAVQQSETLRDAIAASGVPVRDFGSGADDARRLAWQLAISGAIERRIPADRRCPHAVPEARKPLVVLLTSRMMFCNDCRSTFARKVVPSPTMGAAMSATANRRASPRYR